jgi:catalase (peroxidase I)
VKKAGDSSEEALPDIMMLTADVALLKDPSYLKLVKLFAANQTALDVAFREGERLLQGG